MDGITILNVSEYCVRNTGGPNGLFWIFAIAAVFALAGFIYSMITDDNSVLFFGFVLFLAVPFAIISWKEVGGEEITIPEYQVTIDDSVTYKDFVDKYKVIEQEGQIYTIVDKEELATAKNK